MKIESVRIENFRSFKDETIFFDDYTCFVGSNGAGKSTVLNALNVFFRQYKDSKTDLSKLTESDFHHKDTSKEIRITVTFSDLSEQAKTDLSDYVRQDKLIVSAVAKYDPVTEKAEVKQYGNRLGFDTFRRFFEADKNSAKVAELKEIFAALRGSYPQIDNASSKADMISALHTYESNNPDQCVLIPSEDQFYGLSKGANKLAPYIQWVFVPATKDATEESEESKTSALGLLLARTVRSRISFDEKVTRLRTEVRETYQKLLDAEQSSLDSISESLQSKLSSWAHPNISAQVLWKQDPEKSIKIEEPWAYIKLGERGFDGDLSRFGHGLQRSFMLALLQELALVDETNAPTLVMGIEEPELYQHPPQARHLAETLIDLSTKDSQIVLCTHNPLFIPGDSFDKVRIVRETGTPSFTSISSLKYDDLIALLQSVGEKSVKENGMIAKLYPALNPVINEMFFCKNLILVEGQEDIAYITSYLVLSGKINDFRKHGCHIVRADCKSNLIKPIAIANLLKIPVYAIFDCDTDAIPKYVDEHKRDNKKLLRLLGLESENEWPEDHIINSNCSAWITNIGAEIEREIGENWKKYEDKATAFYGNAGGLKKNSLAIAKTLELAWGDGVKSQLLLDLIDRIVSFASVN